MYRWIWILIVLLLPAIAFGQIVEPGGEGGADADSAKGIPFQDTTGNLSDNDIMKYNLANNQWEYETEAGAGSGDDARADTTDAGGIWDLPSPFWLRETGSVNIYKSASGDTLYIDIADAGIGTAEIGTDGVSADELNATGVESELEAVLDLESLQGAVTDGQVPDSLAITLADDSIIKQKFADEDWGDISISSNAASIDAGVVDTLMFNDTETEEYVEDQVGGMLGGTETGIAVSYQDGTDDIDFVITTVSGLAVDGNNALVVKPGTGLDTTGGTIFMDMTTDSTGTGNLARAAAPTFTGVVTLADFLLTTGGNDAAYDPTDVPSDGDQLTWNTDGTTDWQPAAGGAGEANVLADTGTFDEVSGFGLTQTKAGVELRIRGLIEGSNITITKAGTGVNDTALVITASGGSGVWTERSDTLFAVDADGDTVAAFWDDDAGNVRWQVGIEDQTLRLLLDSLGIGGDLIAEFAGDGLTVTSNELTVDLGTVIDTIEITDAQWQEYVADWAGAMVTGNTETGIAVAYQDGDNTLDFTITAVSGLTIDGNNALVAKPGTGLDTTGGTIFHSAHTGDVTGATELTIAANAVESTMVGADQINDLDINFGTGTDQVSATDLPDFGTMTVSANKILVADGVDFESVDMSGDATIASGGGLTISANAVESTMVGVDQINDLDINFGSGTDQVDLADIPGGTAGASAFNFGGATSVEIPAVDAPTTNAEGEIAWDTNDDALEVYSGDEGESVLMPIYRHLIIAIVLPDSVQLYVPDLCVFHANALMYPYGIEIDLVSIQLESDAAYEMIWEVWSAADPPVLENTISTLATGASDTYAEEAPDNDAVVEAGKRIFLNIPSTDVDVVTVEIFFHVTEG